MISAINTQLDLNRQVYDQMLSAQESYLGALADEYKMKSAVSSNQYNDAMGKIKSDLLQKIQGLQATGALNTRS